MIRPHFIFRFALSMLLLTLFFPAHSDEWNPVAYKGRFRPTEAYARLWLYDFYHSQTLKQRHLNLTPTPSSSALDLMWSLHVWGSAPFESSPLFWLQSAKIKQLAGLDPTLNYFSYRELYQAFYEDSRTSTVLIQPLLLYHALKAYTDPANRSRAEKLELRQLAEGLWVQFQGSDLFLAAVPNLLPWTHFQVGQQVEIYVRENATKILAINKPLAEEISEVIAHLQQFRSLSGTHIKQEMALKNALNQLKPYKTPKEIESILNQKFPLFDRLKSAGNILNVLPGSYSTGDWFSLHALKAQVFDPISDDLIPVNNFTLFSDSHFEQVRRTYLDWEQAVLEKRTQIETQPLHLALLDAIENAYQDIAEKTYQKSHRNSLIYPSISQLKWEAFYYRFPLIEIAIVLYALTVLSLGLGYRNHTAFNNRLTFGLLLIAFAWHSCILLLRSYILGRPPVSNMFETVIYVPWIAVALSLFLYKLMHQRLIVLASCVVALGLLILLQVTDLNHSLENVQPVLNSQFWLIVHVLMVVGSYGVFILGGVLGHLYLSLYLFARKETQTMRALAASLLQTQYLGTALLIGGTMLGGVWAAESWGRFWDWDPKESWAFISICVYLIVIHAYRFQKIGHFGLAMGAILGLLAISFTWYGVNYILGTGLHSYGFGRGGQGYYYLFLLLEAGFLLFAPYTYYKDRLKHPPPIC